MAKKLMDADILLREVFPANPSTAPTSQKVILAVIEVIGGFEAFNTYPYHNYENWGQGYRITAQGISVASEYLDDAVHLWQKRKKGEE